MPKLNKNVLPPEVPVMTVVGGNLQVPIALLPEQNLTDLLDMDYFTVVNGKIRPNGSTPTTLGTPVVSFGTSTSNSNVINWTSIPNATAYTLQYNNAGTWTNLYSGALLTYTHTGLSASTGYDYRVKATAVGYTDSAYGLGTKSTASGGSYAVLRALSLNLSSEYADDVTESGITWNNWKPTSTSIQGSAGSASLSALKTEANVATSIGVTNTGGFAGNKADEASYVITPPVYPAGAVNSSFLVQSPTGIKFTGLDATKFYQIYFLTSSLNTNSELSVTIGGVTKTKVATNNYPATGVDRHNNTNLITFNNIVPNGSNEIAIDFAKIGSYYQSTVNLILIEESNIAKP